MSILYITQPGTEIRKRGDRLVVQYQGEVLVASPIRNIERLVLLGPIQLSAFVSQTLLKIGIPVIFASTKGKYYGTLSSGQCDTELLIKQVDLYHNNEYRLKTSRKIISSKIRHQRSLLRRHQRNHPDPDIKRAADAIDAMLPQCQNAESISQVMGYEGQASAAYFGVMRKCLRQSELEFTNRNRRPPLDPVNALLSLGYMLLTGEAITALITLELHLGIGFLHEIAPNRPSLALDLIELFRQPIVDRLTLNLVNRHVFTPGDFVKTNNGGVKLTDDGLKRYLLIYEKTMTTAVQVPGYDTNPTFRKLIADQAQALRDAIRESNIWEPISLEF
ncbi:MAG: CRISPR-associated endonuclease Cas1 [bacterium]